MPVSEIERETRHELSSLTLSELNKVAINDYGIATDFMNRAEIIEKIVSIEVENYFK
jgi:hypothetical protein